MTRSIVRGAALVIGIALLMGAGAAVLLGAPGLALPGLVWGVLIVAGVAFERWRYKPAVTTAGANFVATPERFIDTDTGRPVQVYVDPASGERRYVES